MEEKLKLVKIFIDFDFIQESDPKILKKYKFYKPFSKKTPIGSDFYWGKTFFAN
jgi:hypothetical protein